MQQNFPPPVIFVKKLASRRWKTPQSDSSSFGMRFAFVPALPKESSRGVADNFRSARSSAAQRLNRLEGGRATRGVPAEGDAEACGEEDRGYNSRRLDENGPFEGSGDEPGRGGSPSDAGQSARCAQRRSLDQKLTANVARPRPDGKSEADLGGAFRDADEHDVHDADPADDQRDGGD